MFDEIKFLAFAGKLFELFVTSIKTIGERLFILHCELLKVNYILMSLLFC